MAWYWSFLLGILSGIITSIIFSALSSTFTALKRFVPPRLRKSFDREFKNQARAEKSIINDAKKSDFMYVFAMKGGSFCNATTGQSKLNEIFKMGKCIEQRYLISDPQNPYNGVRAKELVDGVTLGTGILDSITLLTEATTDKNRLISYRLHNEVARYRLIIFDKCLYINWLPKNVKSKDSPIQRYCCDSAGYISMRDFFEAKWEEYKDESTSESVTI